MGKRICGIAISMLLVVALAEAKKPVDGTKIFELQRVKINEVDMPITNYGTFGMSEAHSAGCYWPKGTGQPYIFGAGIWVGAFIERAGGTVYAFQRTTGYGSLPDTLIGDILVSCGYNPVGNGCDFIPGPPDSQDIWDQFENHNSHPENRILFSDSTQDTLLWPYRDCSGEPIFISHHDTWCEYNDLCDSLHRWEAGTYPLGIHIEQMTMAWNTEKTKNMIFFFYYIKNISDDTLKNVFLGHAADDDVGYADDDLLGLDIGRSLGWTMSPTQEPGWSATPPYYVGKKFFQGPTADDTIFVFGTTVTEGPKDTIYPGENIPLTAFSRCTRGYDARTEEQKYQMLAGYNIESFKYDPFGSAADYNPADKRMVMGCGPFTMDPGEIDTLMFGVMFSNGDTRDKEYLLEQGDVAQFMYNGRVLVSDTCADTIISWYRWPVLSAPPVPNVIVVPGDGKVTIVWDNSSENVPDEWLGVMRSANDSLYKEYDFEGYRLWRSRTGITGEWEVIGQWDVKNDITLLPGDSYIPGYGNMSGQNSKNSGLAYSYVDEDIINGVSYFYAVTPYDFNTLGNPNTPNLNVWGSLEAGYKAITCTPRSEPENIIHPTAIPNLTKGATNTVTLTSLVETPIAVTGDEYILKWDETKRAEAKPTEQPGAIVLPVYSYRIYNQTEGEYVTTIPEPIELTLEEEKYISVQKDTIREWATTFMTPVFDGIRLQGKVTLDLTEKRDTTIDTTIIDTIPPDTIIDTTIIDISAFKIPDSICVTTGEYADSLGLQICGFFVPNSSSDGIYTTLENKKWAYRGGVNVEIRWYKTGDTLRAEVWDITNDIEIPFDSTLNTGWCFRGTPPSPPHNKPRNWITASKKASKLYIAGVLYNFNAGSPMTTNGFNSIKEGDIWTIYSSCAVRVPCKGNEFTIKTTKVKYDSLLHQLDKIRVVPNPYLVRTIWDKSNDYRWIQFTNLPSECTIRIYTLAGDLIRVIDHKETSVGGMPGNLGGMEKWDMLTKNDQIIASGVYLYMVTTPNKNSKVGKLAIIR
ncbi:MAG: hypothetical protein HY769_00305 [Candidatus Stahlbacteria bacterium]|nr:hypothetical protein [Candidatus Stahlbacteria bacterium]